VIILEIKLQLKEMKKRDNPLFFAYKKKKEIRAVTYVTVILHKITYLTWGWGT